MERGDGWEGLEGGCVKGLGLSVEGVSREAGGERSACLARCWSLRKNLGFEVSPE